MVEELCERNHEVVEFQKPMVEEKSAVISVGFKSPHRIRSVSPVRTVMQSSQPSLPLRKITRQSENARWESSCTKDSVQTGVPFPPSPDVCVCGNVCLHGGVTKFLFCLGCQPRVGASPPALLPLLHGTVPRQSPDHGGAAGMPANAYARILNAH